MRRTRSSLHAALSVVAASALALGVVALVQPGAAADTAARGHGRATASSPASPKVPVMTGGGGAVASVDQTASRVGIATLRSGGNAADAAVAMAGTLGVTEPYSSGI